MTRARSIIRRTHVTSKYYTSLRVTCWALAHPMSNIGNSSIFNTYSKIIYLHVERWPSPCLEGMGSLCNLRRITSSEKTICTLKHVSKRTVKWTNKWFVHPTRGLPSYPFYSGLPENSGNNFVTSKEWVTSIITLPKRNVLHAALVTHWVSPKLFRDSDCAILVMCTVTNLRSKNN